jgi:hypothetical protein
MSESTETKLWRTYDEKNTLLGTYIPNCLFKSMISGKFSYTELRVVLFMARMTYGFQREETNYLGLEDIEKETNVSKPNLSKAINALIKIGILFLGKKSGGKCKYAINLLLYGAKMKCYKFNNELSVIKNQSSENNKQSYRIYNSRKSQNQYISYNPKGSKDSEKSYIKTDKKIDKKEDNCSKFINNNINITAKHINNHQDTLKDFKCSDIKELNEILNYFIRDVRANIDSDSVIDIIAAYIKKYLIFVRNNLELMEKNRENSTLLFPNFFCEHIASVYGSHGKPVTDEERMRKFFKAAEKTRFYYLGSKLFKDRDTNVEII